MDGKGAPLSYTTAAEWLKKAAEDGDPTAAVNLCGIYGAGKGIERDFVAALQWCIIGENLAETFTPARGEAQRKEQILVKHVTADELEKAKALAGTWLQQYDAKKQP